mmetsp:Transcript_34369/g.76902  ORF Transcript_34369/g.76902 Transcript_34369/m.76902 type:complete len:202 (+) Transcript_34369:1930-2535(+)
MELLVAWHRGSELPISARIRAASMAGRSAANVGCPANTACASESPADILASLCSAVDKFTRFISFTNVPTTCRRHSMLLVSAAVMICLLIHGNVARFAACRNLELLADGFFFPRRAWLAVRCISSVSGLKVAKSTQPEPLYSSAMPSGCGAMALGAATWRWKVCLRPPIVTSRNSADGLVATPPANSHTSRAMSDEPKLTA